MQLHSTALKNDHNNNWIPPVEQSHNNSNVLTNITSWDLQLGAGTGVISRRNQPCCNLVVWVSQDVIWFIFKSFFPPPVCTSHRGSVHYCFLMHGYAHLEDLRYLTSFMFTQNMKTFFTFSVLICVKVQSDEYFLLVKCIVLHRKYCFSNAVILNAQFSQKRLSSVEHKWIFLGECSNSCFP